MRASTVPPASTPETPETAPAQATLRPRAIVGRTLVLAGVFVFVFGILLPRVVDYEAVRAALTALTPGQLALFVAVTVAAYVLSAGPSRVLLPGLTWAHAVGSDLAARAVVSTVPGPTDVATRFVLYRQWSIPADEASAGIGLGGLFETLAYFALPAIAAAGLLVAGQPAQSQALVLALAGLAALAVAAVGLILIVGSEGLARRLGGWLDRLAERVGRLMRRSTPSSMVDGMLDMRVRSSAMLTRRGVLGFAAALVGRLAWVAVLEVALWCVGVGPDVLSPPAVLATVGVVGVVSMVPITPGAVGVAEVAYVAVLSGVAGPGLTDQITAAVSLFRIAQWLGPIPIGWALLLLMRRGHAGGLLSLPRA